MFAVIILSLDISYKSEGDILIMNTWGATRVPKIGAVRNFAQGLSTILNRCNVYRT